MARPAVVVVVNGDPDTLAVLEQALQRRFGADYQVLAAESAVAALEALGRLRGADEQVALLLAEQWLAGMTGVEFLCQAHGLHPAAKRVLLIPYGDVAAGSPGCRRWRSASSTTGSTRRLARPSCGCTRQSPSCSASGPGRPPAPGRSQSGSGWSARAGRHVHMSCATCSVATTSPTGSTTPRAKLAASC